MYTGIALRATALSTKSDGPGSGKRMGVSTETPTVAVFYHHCLGQASYPPTGKHRLPLSLPRLPRECPSVFVFSLRVRAASVRFENGTWYSLHCWLGIEQNEGISASVVHGSPYCQCLSSCCRSFPSLSSDPSDTQRSLVDK